MGVFLSELFLNILSAKHDGTLIWARLAVPVQRCRRSSKTTGGFHQHFCLNMEAETQQEFFHSMRKGIAEDCPLSKLHRIAQLPGYEKVPRNIPKVSLIAFPSLPVTMLLLRVFPCLQGSGRPSSNPPYHGSVLCSARASL